MYVELPVAADGVSLACDHAAARLHTRDNSFAAGDAEEWDHSVEVSGGVANVIRPRGTREKFIGTARELHPAAFGRADVQYVGGDPDLRSHRLGGKCARTGPLERHDSLALDVRLYFGALVGSDA